MDFPARTPQPPYYAVVFSSTRSDANGYDVTAQRMLELAATMPGFLGVESARGVDGNGITVSYWASEEAIRHWGAHAEHRLAQAAGRERFYRTFALRVCRVEAQRLFERD